MYENHSADNVAKLALCNTSMTIQKVALKFGSWNIQGGLRRKCQDEDFVSHLADFDFICLQETWLKPGENFRIDSFSFYRSDRSAKKSSRRNSGGVVIMFRNKFSKGVTKLSIGHPDILWCKLDRNFFGLERDLYVGCAYFSPENSSSIKMENNLVFETLQEDISKFSNQGDVLLLGDLNARTASLQESFIHDDCLSHEFLDVREDIQARSSCDKGVNRYGNQLLDLCSAANLVILNGRVPGDLSGKLTCHKYNGSSLVDYYIVNSEFLSKIQYLKVNDLSVFSDHCSLSCSISTNYSPYVKQENLKKGIQVPEKKQEEKPSE